MKNDVALFTVFYPGIDLFIDDFVTSVKSQTYTKFDLVIINDGYICPNLQALFDDVPIIEIEYNSTPSKNREYGINYVREKGYKYIVLADVDDYFSSKRIERSVNLLSMYDIVVNDLDIISSSGKLLVKSYFSKSIKSSTIIELDFIKKKNVFGFSNTSIRLDALSPVFFPTDIKIVDWYFFTKLLQDKLSAYYLSENLTSYRQHTDNLIGIDDFTPTLFNKLADFKLTHYWYFRGDKEYNIMYENMKRLKSMPINEIQNLISKNRENNPFPLWWENITI